MKRNETYRFAVHSHHFIYPIYIKREVDTKLDSFANILEEVAKEAVQEWMKDFPCFFNIIEAPVFYDSISIMVSKEAATDVQPQ